MEMAGSGSFGSVFRAYDSVIDRWVALKFQTVANADAELDLLRVMSKRRVQNIVNVHGYFDEEHNGVMLRCMAMDWYHMTLSDVSRGRVPANMKDQTNHVSLKLLVSIAKDLAFAVETLHLACIVHCDIKPCNVLIRVKSLNPPVMEARLADMGSARDTLAPNEGTTTHDNRWVDEYIVTRNYRAPEVMFGMELGYGLDLWALGVTMYELLVGKLLFTNDDYISLISDLVELIGMPNDDLLERTKDPECFFL